MCGRYRLKDPAKAFAWLEVVPRTGFLPRFNIAPTQRVAAIRTPGVAEPMAWGIPAAWSASRPHINARSEGIREKRSFKEAFATRRCLVPADGFYEWSREGKQPHFLALRDEEPFAIGAVWEGTTPEGPRCCLLTTRANAVISPFHDRMPVIIPREAAALWLAPEPLADADFDRLTSPINAARMTETTVSPLVNNARVDDPRCCQPGDAPQPPLRITRSPAEDAQGMFGF